MCTYICTSYVHVYTRVYMCIHVDCVYIHTYICTSYVHVYTCVYIHTYIRTSYVHVYTYVTMQSRKWHTESENFGRRWSVGDVVGCLLNIDGKTICKYPSHEMCTMHVVCMYPSHEMCTMHVVCKYPSHEMCAMHVMCMSQPWPLPLAYP